MIPPMAHAGEGYNVFVTGLTHDEKGYPVITAEAQEKLLTIIRSMKRTKIISIENDYLHAECTSAIFRYVDDVEFYFDDEQKLIHFRSSSRLGYYDVGVNRRRMGKIWEKFLGN